MKKRNPASLTNRNARAYNKKFEKLTTELKDLKKRVRALERRKG